MSMVVAVAVAMLLIALDVALRGTRIRLLLPRATRPRLGRAVAVNALGDLASALTPARVGGEVVRYTGFRQAAGTAPSITALAVERVLDLALLGIGTLGLMLLAGGDAVAVAGELAGRLTGSRWRPWLAVVGAAVAVSVPLAFWLRRRLPSAVGAGLRQGLVSVRELSGHRVAVAGGLTIVSFLLRVAVLPVLMLSMASGLDPVVLVLASWTLLFGQLVIPTPAGAGGVELGFLAGFAGVLPADDLAMLLILWRACTLMLPILPAGPAAVDWLRRRRTARAAALAAVGIVVWAIPAAGQGPAGSRLVSVDHWAYELVERLRFRGMLPDLNPLVQPYSRTALARALDQLSADTLPEPEAEWVRMLREELVPRAPARTGEPSWGVSGFAGGRASTSDRLDPARPAGDGGAWPLIRGGGWFVAGPVAAEMRLRADPYLSDDPDGVDRDARRGALTDHAYLAVTLPHVTVLAGRVGRNWSALGTRGAALSAVSEPFPQIEVALDAGPLTVRGLTGELDVLQGDQRYLAAHRVDLAWPRVAVSFGETIVYARQRGDVALRFLNPLEFFFFEVDAAPLDGTRNLMLDGQFWIDLDPVVLYGEFLLDDIDVRPRGDAEPLLYAFTAGARTPGLVRGRVDAGIQYEQVSAWAYRTPNVTDRYSFLGRGLGANFADFDRLSAWLDVYPPVTGLRLTPRVTMQRQGEGDFRDSIPPRDQYLASPTLFLGQKETTLRLALEARYQPRRWIWASVDLGPNVIRNRGHVAGAAETTFEAVAALGVRLDVPLGTLR